MCNILNCGTPQGGLAPPASRSCRERTQDGALAVLATCCRQSNTVRLRHSDSRCWLKTPELNTNFPNPDDCRTDADFTTYQKRAPAGDAFHTVLHPEPAQDPEVAPPL